MDMAINVEARIRVLQASTLGMVTSFALLLPVRSPVVADLMPGKGTSSVGRVVGFMAAGGGVFEFLVGPVFGKLSDHLGRKRVLLFGLSGSGVMRLLAYLRRGSLRWIFAERVVSMGTDAVVITCIRASLSDLVRGEQLALAQPKISAAAGLGIISGPALSLALQQVLGSREAIYLLSAALGLTNATCMASVFKETLWADLRTPFTWKAANPFSFLDLLGSSAAMQKLMTVSLLQSCVDGRNVADTDFAFQRGQLGWSAETCSKYVICAGLRIFLAGAVGPMIIRGVGMSRITSFSNAVNAFFYATLSVFPTYQFSIVFAGVLGERKRDAVESMATDLGIRYGFSKGQIAAAIGNWRALATIIAPLAFSNAFAFAAHQKKMSGSSGPATLHYVLAALLSVLAELVYRTPLRRDLDDLKSRPPGRQSR